MGIHVINQSDLLGFAPPSRGSAAAAACVRLWCLERTSVAAWGVSMAWVSLFRPLRASATLSGQE